MHRAVGVAIDALSTQHTGSKANRNLCAALRHYQQGGMVRQGCAGEKREKSQSTTSTQ